MSQAAKREIATSMLGERYDSRHGLRQVKYRFKFKFQTTYSFSLWKKMWENPWYLGTCESFPRLTFSCWWFHRMQSMKQYGFRGLIFTST